MTAGTSLMLLIFGLAIAVWVLFDMVSVFRAFASRNWPSVTGTIVKSRCERGRNTFRPVVTYRYTVEGTEHRADRIAFWGVFGGAIFSQESAQSWTCNWDEGYPAEVRYDPKRPGLAVLRPGATGRLFGSVLFGLITGSSYLFPKVILLAELIRDLLAR
jgi:hypothetical protein